jgi:precorrin-6B methylase 2
LNLVGGLVLGLVLGAVLSLLIYQAKTGVPAVPSTSAEIAVVVSLLRTVGLPEHARLYELGCGWGSMAVGLARAFPQATIVGFEISPLPYLVARMRAVRQKNVIIRRRDFRREQIQGADGIVVYLGIRAISRLALQLDTAVQPGTKVVTLCFSFRDRNPTAVTRVRGLGGVAGLYLWPANFHNVLENTTTLAADGPGACASRNAARSRRDSPTAKTGDT